MTIEEAIYALTYHTDKGRVEARKMAIAALRAQQEAEKNEPLTLEELRGMYGWPVWIVPKGTCPAHWRIWSENEPYDFECFAAYRRPPVGGVNLMRKINLCGLCAAKMKEAYIVRRTGGGVNNKITCAQCGKRKYGGAYEVEKKEA